ncbi:MAG: energy-coupling factor transporter transmembrane component T [Clostridia bacterium]
MVVIAFSIAFLHPVFLIISFLIALSFAILLRGGKAVKFALCFIFPTIIIFSLVNAITSHYGVTNLFKLGINYITLESIAFGLASGTAFSTVIIWFFCFNQTVTTDMMLDVFSVFSRKIALVISMALRLVPLYNMRLKKMHEVSGSESKNFFYSVKLAVLTLSGLISWALEQSVITADSMSARGYGIGLSRKRTLGKFSKTDALVLVLLLLFTATIIFFGASGQAAAQYNPRIIFSSPPVYFIILYTLFCAFPIIFDSFEVFLWHLSRSKI